MTTNKKRENHYVWREATNDWEGVRRLKFIDGESLDLNMAENVSAWVMEWIGGSGINK
jgi:hypothetical protein